MEFFAKIVDDFQPLSIFPKNCILDALQDFENASERTTINPFVFIAHFLYPLGVRQRKHWERMGQENTNNSKNY